MPVTALWSPLHGAYTTVNTLVLAVCLAEGHGIRTLITQTHFSLNDLERPLIGKRSVNTEELFGDIGLDAVARLYKSNSFELAGSAAIPIGPAGEERLFLLPGTTKKNRETFDNAEERLVLKKVLKELGRIYGAVLIDTNAGYGDQSMAVLEAADNIVICLRQNRGMIEEVLSSDRIRDLAGKKQIFFLFGEYDETARLNLSNVRRMYRNALHKSNTGAVPYDTGLCDAVSDCAAFRYIVRSLELDSEEEDEDAWWSAASRFALKLC